MKTITVGLIGAGNIRDSHLAGLRVYPEYRLAAVCDLDPARVRETVERFGGLGFTDYRDLLAAGPDVAVICLPHSLHAPVAVEALASGCHVVVEKPMATTVADCNRMLRAAGKAGRHLLVADSAAFLPGPLLTGRKFAAGGLGRFFTGYIPQIRPYFGGNRPAWFLDPEKSGGGMFANVGLHRLAVARACLPGLTPLSVSASVSFVPEYAVEACTSALVRYGNGSLLYEEVGYHPRPDAWPIQPHLVFENGLVTWDDRTWRMTTRSGRGIRKKLVPHRAAYAPVYANLLRALAGGDYRPRAWECAQDVAVVQAAYAGARAGREIRLDGPSWRIHDSLTS